MGQDSILLNVSSPSNWTTNSIIPIKIPADFCVETDDLILKFIWKCKNTKIGKTHLKKNTIWFSRLIIKLECLWQCGIGAKIINRSIKQKRVQKSAHTYMGKWFKVMQWRKKQSNLFNKCSWNNWIYTKKIILAILFK